MQDMEEGMHPTALTRIAAHFDLEILASLPSKYI